MKPKPAMDFRQVVSSQVGSVLKDTKSVIQDANSSLQEVEKLLGDVRLISDTANYARVYCTYAIFAITMFAAVMVIVGVVRPRFRFSVCLCTSGVSNPHFSAPEQCEMGAGI